MADDPGPVEKPATTARGRLPVRLFVAVYLAFQLLLPLPGLVRDKLATRGNFSWNMYADTYTCSVLYTVHELDGRIRTVDYDAQFRNEVSSTRILHRDTLPSFHRWLCRELAPGEELWGLVSCRLNDGPWIDLVRPAADLCSPAERGVE